MKQISKPKVKSVGEAIFMAMKGKNKMPKGMPKKKGKC